MDELVKALQKFLMRDLAFILGGSAVLLSFLAAFDGMPKETTPTVWYFFGGGFAYVVGYAIQEWFVILHGVRTKAGVQPPSIAKWLYERFERRPLTKMFYSGSDYDQAKKILLTRAPERLQADHERTESLKQFGNTIGPCMLISAGILAAGPLLNQVGLRSALVGGGIFLGLALVLCGWLKVTQQAQYVFRVSDAYSHETPATRPNTPQQPTGGAGGRAD